MFANAYQIAAGFTKPVIISSVNGEGECRAAVGSFIVINDEGWVLTAAHIINHANELMQQKQSYADYESAKSAIENDKGLLTDQKRKKVRQLTAPDRKKHATDFSYWWVGASTPKNVTVLQETDLAVMQLDPPVAADNYPTFKDPSKGIAPGTSLCRLGFPFHAITPTYDGKGFNLPAAAFPMVFFPNEGIFTRVLVVTPSPDRVIGYIETSSAGLMGQSGGPIFDQHGTVWGVQSHTTNLPLGFSPPVPNGRPGEKEHQFLNVGRGAHPATIVGLLSDLGVKHELSAY